MELQQIDNELQTIEAIKGDLPQRVDELKSELQSVETNLNELKEALAEAKKSKFHLEGEAKVLDEQLKKYQDQLFAVKTNKEYDAITVEIEATKEKIDEVETRYLETLESEEKLAEEVKDLEEQVKILHDNLAAKQKKLEIKIRETENDSQILHKKRDELVAHIRKPFLYQYERIRKGKNGSAVVEINKYSCSGCFTTIPPQRALEIRYMNQLILCDSCGRILVYRNQQETVASEAHN
jgi:predicted  nucleic acid-binding Zn-ribbon protein